MHRCRLRCVSLGIFWQCRSTGTNLRYCLNSWKARTRKSACMTNMFILRAVPILPCSWQRTLKNLIPWSLLWQWQRRIAEPAPIRRFQRISWTLWRFLRCRIKARIRLFILQKTRLVLYVSAPKGSCQKPLSHAR